MMSVRLKTARIVANKVGLAIEYDLKGNFRQATNFSEA
jgi:hypothetical protein